MSSACGRRSFVSLIGLSGFALSLKGFAQQGLSSPTRRIGFLIGEAPTMIRAFEEELRKLGYVQGENLHCREARNRL